MVPVWSAKAGITVHNNKSYVLKPTYFKASPLMITAMAVNEIDVVMLGPSQLNIAVGNAGLGDLRVISDEIVDGHEGYYSTSYFVLKDGGINSPSDLKGKIVSTFGIGSSADIAARNFLSKQGLEQGRDYTLLEAAPPNQKALLFEKKAALAVLIPPFAYDPEVQDKARVLFTARDGYGVTVSAAYWAAREGFIAKNRAAIVDMLEDYLRLGRWFWDPANRKEALQIRVGLHQGSGNRAAELQPHQQGCVSSPERNPGPRLRSACDRSPKAAWAGKNGNQTEFICRPQPDQRSKPAAEMRIGDEL